MVTVEWNERCASEGLKYHRTVGLSAFFTPDLMHPRDGWANALGAQIPNTERYTPGYGRYGR